MLAAMLSDMTAFAETYPEIVIDAHSGIVLHQDQANRSWYPASLTKMMTLLLTFDALAAGNLTMDEKINVSKHAASQSPVRLGVRAGEKLTVKQAIMAVATVSANDVAVVLAERLGGSESAFAELMTRKAIALGMSGTQFRNASGLPDSQQKTTARDMALLGAHLFKHHQQYYHFFSNRSISYKGRRRGTTNGFTGSYSGADGIKTGFTCGSGYNLVTSAQRNGVRLVGVVLGAANGSVRSQRMRKLLDLGFANSKQAISRPSIGELNSTTTGLPPIRLGSGKCGHSAPTKFIFARGKLPGWGILLGVKADRNSAMSIIKKARSQLKSIGTNPRPAILKRDFQKGTSWKILMVSMEKEQAGKACLHLLANAMSCVIQSPRRMNSPGYSLR